MKKFVELYDGNATQTAIKAGYKAKNAKVVGCQNLTKLNHLIQKRQGSPIDRASKLYILSREERQSFWAEVMLSDKIAMADRLRASELLGKSEADFTDKLQHTGAYSLAPSEEMIRLFDEFKARQRKVIDVK